MHMWMRRKEKLEKSGIKGHVDEKQIIDIVKMQIIRMHIVI